MTKQASIFVLVLALCSCGSPSPSTAESEATRAVDAVDASSGNTSTALDPVKQAPLAVSSMPTTIPAGQTGEVLAVSAMSNQLQPGVPPQIVGPVQPTNSTPGPQVETLPSYPPRSGITTGRLCAAAIGSIMGLTELQVGIDHESPSIARVGYQKADRTRWTYDCRFDGSHITWRTVEDGRPGRWRTDPADEVITFAMTPEGANVTVNGEVVRIAA